MTPILRLTSMFASFIFTRHLSVNHRHSGSSTARTSVSCQFIVNMMSIEPTIVSAQMMMFSGPWWASSVISNRSPVSRLTSVPVRFLS